MVRCSLHCLHTSHQGAIFRAILVACNFAQAQEIVSPLVKQLATMGRYWECFLCARAALALGHPALAAPIFRDLTPRVISFFHSDILNFIV